MILVLVTHASYASLGSPTQADISNSLCNAFMRSISESLSEVCVNTFILISGWYGITFKFEKLSSLIFQVLFISISLYFTMRLAGMIQPLRFKEWIDLLLFRYSAYWFVRAYIILYIFSPLLNAFVDNCSCKQLRIFIICFYILQTIYGFYNSNGWFSSGYSPLSFMGLYLLARYMRLYPDKYVNFNKFTDIIIFFSVSLFTVVCSLSQTYFLGTEGTILFQYSSPFVIVSSLYFFLFFTKISIRSRIINWISVSCFAVYLVHCSPFVLRTYYMNLIKEWSNKEPMASFFFCSTLLMVAYYCFSILIDKVRIAVWKKISAWSIKDRWR